MLSTSKSSYTQLSANRDKVCDCSLVLYALMPFKTKIKFCTRIPPLCLFSVLLLSFFPSFLPSFLPSFPLFLFPLLSIWILSLVFVPFGPLTFQSQ
ncbi:uncharacterized protein C8Q71DRAFT_245877 [Rhodofomes roseus]|uniref:Uncharacterized protein n=1 Tax=Rhodofomes roseus TaxID=34475 RepID=A0ABQ8K7D9_9APHY|nr:uncharacterized protein C8Q71DRAFT_245877 [Rhodofomes roseus]KAH9832957.1 hypothetical protein C8Q71DRAFT_245877 [Rhodofomes roseus]